MPSKCIGLVIGDERQRGCQLEVRIWLSGVCWQCPINVSTIYGCLPAEELGLLVVTTFTVQFLWEELTMGQPRAGQWWWKANDVGGAFLRLLPLEYSSAILALPFNNSPWLDNPLCQLNWLLAIGQMSVADWWGCRNADQRWRSGDTMSADVAKF